jgi:hypothetical protein
MKNIAIKTCLKILKTLMIKEKSIKKLGNSTTRDISSLANIQIELDTIYTSNC